MYKEKTAKSRIMTACLPILILTCSSFSVWASTLPAPYPAPKPANAHRPHKILQAEDLLQFRPPATADTAPAPIAAPTPVAPAQPSQKPAAIASAPTTQAPAVPVPPVKPHIPSQKSEAAPVIAATKEATASTEAPAAPAKAARKKKSADHSKPLSVADSILYKKIFAWQAQAEWAKADELIAQLDNDVLRGHLLYQRYMHPTAYKASFPELAAWLRTYADHPNADKAYKLAELRRPKGDKTKLAKPGEGPRSNGFLDVLHEPRPAYASHKKRGDAQMQDIHNLRADIRQDVSKGAPTQAYKRLTQDRRAKFLDNVEYDQMRALIAQSYMLSGNIEKAYELATASARRSGKYVPQAAWVGGLAAWRTERYKRAIPLFEMAASSEYFSGWGAAGAAYWASRAHMRAGHTKEVSKWLEKAAAQPRTFYGLIATRALGWDFAFNWDMPDLTSGRRKQLEDIPAAQRAFALVAAGQYHLAEQELRRIDAHGNKDLQEAIMAYAHSVDLPYLALRMAESIPHPDGGLYDAALYPYSPWRPEGGFTVDRALIHAIIRQESRFNPHAESRTGAMGLMQLMPRTASYVSGDTYKDKAGAHSLKDPQLNIDIGQRYVETLLNHGQVGAELFSLVIAYNAGPGNLKKWKEQFADMQDDPLLFIESIPMSETRAFVERVMSNYWIYRLRMEQDTPSLDAVAEGRWAHYESMDGIKRADAGDAGAKPGALAFLRRFAAL